jgi:hypothetical protein
MIASAVTGITIKVNTQELAMLIGNKSFENIIGEIGSLLILMAIMCVMAHAFCYLGMFVNSATKWHPNHKDYNIRGMLDGGLYDPEDFV